jgi:hypothetical protein
MKNANLKIKNTTNVLLPAAAAEILHFAFLILYSRATSNLP